MLSCNNKILNNVVHDKLRFICWGGWSQHDEANPDPIAMINQMSYGHDYLLKNFGITPKVAWQIDPFGHSSVTPSLFQQMGFEALVINRIHHGLKDFFKGKQTMEFLWRG